MAQSDYEVERMLRIQENKKRLEAIGISHQRSILESFRVVKKVHKTSDKPYFQKKNIVTSAPVLAVLSRRSKRLQGEGAELSETSTSYCGADGLFEEALVDLMGRDGSRVSRPSQELASDALERRCASQGRGSVYDSVLGITCHFCRQKKLCGEEDCQRCSTRDDSLPCIGKTECTRCGSATGRFCRACLLIRYGQEMVDARAAMKACEWLCPHCYEEEHPSCGWICNSSICMKRRGMRPTGIAIYEAQQCGFVSVAHFLQAQLQNRQSQAPRTQECYGCDSTTDVAPASSNLDVDQSEQPACVSAEVPSARPSRGKSQASIVDALLRVALEADGGDHSDKENRSPIRRSTRSKKLLL